MTVEARLRYRQSDQQVAAKILGEVPDDINLEKIYGIKSVPALPVVEMAAKKASFSSKQP